MFIAPLPNYTRYNIMLGLCVCAFSLPRQAALGKPFPVATKDSWKYSLCLRVVSKEIRRKTSCDRNTDFMFQILYWMSQDGSVDIAKIYGPENQGSIPYNEKQNILYCTMSRLTLGPTQDSIQWVRRVFSGMKLLIHLHLVLRWRRSELCLPSTYVFMAWCLSDEGFGKFTFALYSLSTIMDICQIKKEVKWYRTREVSGLCVKSMKLITVVISVKIQ
jgi:hypothetical protein